MIRKQVYITPAADRKLKREARRRGVSEAALIREGIELIGRGSGTDDEAERKRFIKTLQKAAREAMKYPGDGWKFQREDVYEERLARQRPR